MPADDGLRARIHEAFAGARAHPALRARVVAAVADAGPERRRPVRALALGGVAIALAVAVVAVLVATRGGGQAPAGRPAPAVPPATASPGGSLRMASAPGFRC